MMASPKNIAILISAVCLVASVVLLSQRVGAINLVEQLDQASGKSTVTLAVVENPELVTRVLESLLRSIVYSASVDMQQTR